MSPASVQALDSSQVRNLGLGAIAVIVLVGLLLALLISKLVVRVIVLLIALVLAVLVYQQRDRVAQAVSDTGKRCEASFFGIHVEPHDPAVRRACEQAGKVGSR
ncbi:MAG: hypothetical protein JO144_11695 [Actinobacteria bacterium]|nr:hypothetical protein [Actinomycetota bacterium]